MARAPAPVRSRPRPLTRFYEVLTDGGHSLLGPPPIRAYTQLNTVFERANRVAAARQPRTPDRHPPPTISSPTWSITSGTLSYANKEPLPPIPTPVVRRPGSAFSPLVGWSTQRSQTLRQVPRPAWSAGRVGVRQSRARRAAERPPNGRASRRRCQRSTTLLGGVSCSFHRRVQVRQPSRKRAGGSGAGDQMEKNEPVGTEAT